MITFVRTESIAPGKLVEALTFTPQIAAFVEKIIGHKVGVSSGSTPFRGSCVEGASSLACARAGLMTTSPRTSVSRPSASARSSV